MKDNAGTTRKAKFTWDALGRRIEYIDDTNSTTTRYYYDGVNEVYEYNASGDPQRYFVHGVSYIDERLAMVNCYGTTGTSDDRPYYYCIDRMYNVRFIVDRAGAVVERYAYDPYGKPFLRESFGRGDMNNDTWLHGVDAPDMADAVAATIWDSRADIDDDGDADSADTAAYAAKDAIWPQPSGDQPTVAQAFSDVGNPYMFQGVPHFAIDTSSSATTVKFPLNHHRARFAEPITGRWGTRDPLSFNQSMKNPSGLGFITLDVPYSRLRMQILGLTRSKLEIIQSRSQHADQPSWTMVPSALSNQFLMLSSSPTSQADPSGLTPGEGCVGPDAQNAADGLKNACKSTNCALDWAVGDGQPDSLVDLLVCMAVRCEGDNNVPSVHVHCDYCCSDDTYGYTYSELCQAGIQHHITLCPLALVDDGSGTSAGIIEVTIGHEISHCCGSKDEGAWPTAYDIEQVIEVHGCPGY